MSKDEMIEILDSAFANGTPFIDFTDDYVYVLKPEDADGSTWTEAVYMKEDSEVEKRTFPAEKAWAMFLEEFEKGLPGCVDDLSVAHIREVREGFGNMPAAEKIKALIADVTANAGSYAANLPVIKSQGEIEDVKGKL
ncbi:MAG TPA: hypothetical protein VKK79_18160 [Candidatus Lokiarchaeia archaeon]|nr:hypothetical protein [Candidatus Lokiarchaeia archaeon]